MSERAYSEEELREVIELFENPVAVGRGARVLLVNDAFLRQFGYRRDEVEGHPFDQLLAPEERSRAGMQLQLNRLVPRGWSFPVLGLTKDGRVFREQIQIQTVPAKDGGAAYSLSNILVLGEQPREVEEFGLLVEVALSLTWERSQTGVREATIRGFARADHLACFCRQDGTLLAGSPDLAVKPDPTYVRDALSEGRPVFGGMGARPTQVYLPLRQGSSEPEVLYVSCASVNSEHASVWNLFARQVSSALSTAKLIADLERRNEELRAVAEVARLAAQPAASLSDMIAIIARALDADAAALMLRRTDGLLALEDGWGLSPEERARLNKPTLWGGALPWETGATSANLLQSGEALGQLWIVRRRGAPLDAVQERMLTTLSDLLLSAIEQRRLRAESDRKLRETQLLLELARLAAGTPDLDRLLDVACDAMVRLLKMSICHIMLWDEKAQLLRGAVTNSTAIPNFRDDARPLDSLGLTQRCAREKRVLVVENAQAELLNPGFIATFGYRACVCLPLIAGDELVGVVSLSDDNPLRHFDQEWLDFASATVTQLALTIANARLYASLKQSYLELEQTRAEKVKQERLAALGELSAVVAHEVRNPLGVIFNAVGSLRRLIEQKGDAQLLLDILAEESDRLNRMVGELLDFARPSSLSLEPADLAKVIDESLTAARSQQGSDKVRFISEIDPSLPAVRMDRRMFRQALVNVAVNAVQAMPKGGTLRVLATQERLAGSWRVRVDVSDDGPGIPASHASRIFEPFFTTKAQGTGLGLAVVKRIIEEHRGEVEFASREGQGTTFTFRLPIDPEPERRSA
jgi:two-component system sensor histidine kinase HydH